MRGNLLCLATLLVAAFATTAFGCSDRNGAVYCQQHKHLCSTWFGIKYLCERTCGVCGGVVTRPPPRTLPTPKTGKPLTPPKTRKPLPPTAPPQPGSCGMRQVKSARVIGGKKASRGDWPWQIRLLKTFRFICGGTLISPTWVVTASHCVVKSPIANQYEVQVGVTDARANEPSSQRHKVKRIIMHPEYNRKPLDNDIALLELATPVQMNQMVQPACLPRQGDAVPVGTTCYITGFGKTSHPGKSSSVMMQAPLPVVSKSTCSDLNTRKTRIPITDNMVCAGHGSSSQKESGCHGDSGGPFVCQNSRGAFTLHGAVSWGSNTCDSSLSYTVFARVSQYRSWIDKHMSS